MTRLVIVTGVSCAGKTTLGEQLFGYDGVTEWWDLDQAAPAKPRTAWLDWLRWRAAEHLLDAVDRARPDDDSIMVMSGIVWPFQLIQSPAWRQARKTKDLAVEFLMLDPAWKVLRRRLDERTAEMPKGERVELRNYNRGLRAGLRDQCVALQAGYTWTLPHLHRLPQLIITEDGWES